MEAVELQVDKILLDVVIRAGCKALSVSEVNPIPVGASRLAAARHSVSAIVGLVGRNSGTVTINISEHGMFYLAGRMLGEPQTEVCEDNIDAMMEIGNLVAGGIKEGLQNTIYQVDAISLPSLVFGQSFSVAYSRGITTVSVDFELDDLPMSRMGDRIFSVSVSLLRGSGSGR